MRIKNFLVTGGAGFIGSHLCEYLLKLGHKVIIIDNFSTGKKYNLLKIKNKIKLYDGNVENFNFNILIKSDIDVIIHLSSQTSVPLSIKNFKKSSKSNILSFINLLSFANSNSIPLVYASSSAIYGNLKFGNDQNTKIDLLSPYSADKLFFEKYCEVFYKLNNFSSIGLRFFNVYGPRQDADSPYSGVISIFTQSMLRNNLITINGGNQTRDFIHVYDVVKSIYTASSLVSKKKHNEYIYILTGKSISINKLFQILNKKIKYSKKPLIKQISLGDPLKSSGSIIKMKQILKINNDKFININNGLETVINHFNNE